MPTRTVPLANGEYYHIYNHGTGYQPVFLQPRDYKRFLLTLSYYRFADLPLKLSHLLQLPKEEREILLENTQKHHKLIEIVSFVLMPNHFHLLLKQNLDGGLRTFVGNATNSYVHYFNTKHDRLGPLLQGPFKAVHVQTDEQLVHLSRYIHLNPVVSFVVRESEFLSYPWSSLSNFLKGDVGIVGPEIVLAQFPSRGAYKQFVLDQVDYGKKLELIKHLTHESQLLA